MQRSLLIALALTLTTLSHASESGLNPEQLGLLINMNDPESIMIGAYYIKHRKIPNENIIRVRINQNKAVLSRTEFAQVKKKIDGLNLERLQALAVAWIKPYRVDCMSLTSALAFGFDEAYCAKGCKGTKRSPYFNSQTRTPNTTLGMRPVMMLAGTDVKSVEALIKRGIESDDSHPKGTAYLVDTSDKNRSVRAMFYPEIKQRLGEQFKIKIHRFDALLKKQDVMFYFTGLKHVKGITTNHFLPGAVADHLTSAGGKLTGENKQMSSLKWLEAGATASYGTVVEPCNFPEKFPHPGIIMQHYLNGDTIIEAYWKSVAMPGQGVFIGEPLAKPFGK